MEPDLAPGKPQASASLEEIAVAGFVVVRHCADKGEEGGEGGIARGIGESCSLCVFLRLPFPLFHPILFSCGLFRTVHVTSYKNNHAVLSSLPSPSLPPSIALLPPNIPLPPLPFLPSTLP